MSDTAPQPGWWWQASDGQWYPPASEALLREIAANVRTIRTIVQVYFVLSLLGGCVLMLAILGSLGET